MILLVSLLRVSLSSLVLQFDSTTQIHLYKNHTLVLVLVLVLVLLVLVLVLVIVLLVLVFVFFSLQEPVNNPKLYHLRSFQWVCESDYCNDYYTLCGVSSGL